MNEIGKATPNQAERLFDIMVQATEAGCATSYPPEVIEIWHKGRSAEGMANAIANAEVYSLRDRGAIRGFVHIQESEVVGLFVNPDDHRKGYGTELFRFATKKISLRPIVVKATLNAVPFYSRFGCYRVAIESVRRHDHDIYIVRMNLD
ncbi:MAG TPA: GNAT family N-acetyltransferase [candidate division Zixibacteria bacterium]|nr:GNAT family N-acetyltransferase [candidate division Zixibacteria bacterium]